MEINVPIIVLFLAKISAKNGTNIDTLVEAIFTLAELIELKCDPTGRAEATVIEAKVGVTFIIKKNSLWFI